MRQQKKIYLGFVGLILSFATIAIAQTPEEPSVEPPPESTSRGPLATGWTRVQGLFERPNQAATPATEAPPTDTVTVTPTNAPRLPQLFSRPLFGQGDRGTNSSTQNGNQPRQAQTRTNRTRANQTRYRRNHSNRSQTTRSASMRNREDRFRISSLWNGLRGDESEAASPGGSQTLAGRPVAANTTSTDTASTNGATTRHELTARRVLPPVVNAEDIAPKTPAASQLPAPATSEIASPRSEVSPGVATLQEPTLPPANQPVVAPSQPLDDSPVADSQQTASAARLPPITLANSSPAVNVHSPNSRVSIVNRQPVAQRYQPVAIRTEETESAGVSSPEPEATARIATASPTPSTTSMSLFRQPSWRSSEERPTIGQDSPQSTELVKINPSPATRPVLPELTDVRAKSKLPSLAVDYSGPDTVRLNQKAMYEVAVSNSSDIDAENVAVRIEVPQWIDVLATQVANGEVQKPVDSSQPFEWTLPLVEAGRQQQLRLTVAAREVRPFELAMDVRQQPLTSLASLNVLEPDLELNIEGPAEIRRGKPQRLKIDVLNPGTGLAEGVKVHIKYDDEATRAVTIDSLASGETKSLVFDFTPQRVGPINFQLSASNDSGLKAENEYAAVVRAAQLQLTAEGPEVRFAGTVANYKIKAANTGDASAENVMITTTLPPGVQALNTVGGVNVDGRIQWPLGSIAPGETRSVSMQCQLNSPGSQALQFQSEAEGGLTAVTTIDTQVEAVADLRLDVTEPQGPLPVGQTVQYTIDLVNQGVEAAREVNVVVHFSQGIKPTVATSGGKVEMTNVTFPMIDSLEPGQRRTMQVSATAIAEGSQYYRVEAIGSNPPARRATEGTTYFYQAK